MGLTFKENCSDTRNSGIEKVINELKKFKIKLDLYDSWTDPNEIKKKYNIKPVLRLSKNTYDAVIISVSHDKFKSLGINHIFNACEKKHIIFDLKNVFNSSKVDLRLQAK